MGAPSHNFRALSASESRVPGGSWQQALSTRRSRDTMRIPYAARVHPFRVATARFVAKPSAVLTVNGAISVSLRTREGRSRSLEGARGRESRTMMTQRLLLIVMAAVAANTLPRASALPGVLPATVQCAMSCTPDTLRVTQVRIKPRSNKLRPCLPLAYPACPLRLPWCVLRVSAQTRRGSP